MLERFEREAKEHAWLAHLGRDPQVVEDAAAVVAYILADPMLDPLEDVEPLEALHQIVVLGLGLARDPGLVVDALASESKDDLNEIDATARGKSFEPGGPLAGFVARARSRLERTKGWARSGERFSHALADLVAGVVQRAQMQRFDGSTRIADILRDAQEGAWVPALLRGCVVVTADSNPGSRTAQFDLALRLCTSAIGWAEQLRALEHEDDQERIAASLAHRFVLPAQVIALSAPQLHRALQATLNLELHDLADATDYLDASEPLPRCIERCVTATTALLGPTKPLDSETPERASREEIMERLRDVAREDGRITTDERALLREVDRHLSEFETIARRIDEDQMVDFDEFRQLRSCRLELVEAPFRTALADQTVTDDERQLLVRAMELVVAVR